MTKAVFTSKIGSGYDDNVELHYHFPRSYLRAVEEAIGDLIVYYEPRRGDGELAYFGTAEVTGVRPDPARPDHFYADLRNYIDFDRKVPFHENGQHYESALRKDDGSHNMGSFQRAVRRIPNDEFQAIVAAGFPLDSPWPETLAPAAHAGMAEPDQEPFDYGERSSVILSRPFRDRMFTRRVQRVYDRRCAVTGLRLLNGGGRPEVQAAHIQPVAAAGPDSVRNGIALSGTVHWLFDDDFAIRTVAGAIPESITALINPSRKLLVPEQHTEQPSLAYLRYHREHVFKG
jgi:putative restriction endonuclease